MVIPRAQFFLKRLLSSPVSTKNALEHLKKRSLIEIKGPDVSEFLQGLITNDIHHLSNGVGSMFTMFLNTKGRILYDALIYKTEEQNVYLIECDSEANAALQKHLKIYKVKRKVTITGLSNHMIYALFNLSYLVQEKNKNIAVLNGEYEKTSFPESSTDLKMYKDLYIFKDPRVSELGFRIVTKNTVNVHNSLESLIKCERSDNYKKLRYSLGVGEGIDDLPVGNSNPLECNCDYLHGVSFHKGCYIGQELTARTHHTGVIRKRLMPLLFTKIPKKLPENNVILHNNVNLGKLRGIEGDVGLGLVRIKKALDFKVITVEDGEARVIKPEWWPIELPKEKLNVQVSLTMEQHSLETVTAIENVIGNIPSTSDIKAESVKSETECDKIIQKDQNDLKYFDCALCNLREKFEYFGKEPPFIKNYKLLEEAYVIEDPFLPLKSGKILVIGSHCIKCNKMVCKSINCNTYFNGTFCILCAKKCMSDFPTAVQEKLNRIVI